MPRGIGTRLRSARERAGLSVVEAAEKLHVDAGLLQALESERFDELGAPVYVRGHIRHYANLVQESPVELEELYRSSRHAANQPDLSRIPRVERERFSSTLLIPGVSIVAAVALIGTGWWVAGALSRTARMRRLAVAAASRPVSPPAAEGPRPASAAPAVPSVRAAAAAPGGREAGLALHFSQDSWTEVYDARGQRLFYDIGRAGSTRTVSGVPPLRLVLGNAPAVSVEFDGRPVAMPDAPHDRTADFRIGPSGRIALIRRSAAASRAENNGERPRRARRSALPTATQRAPNR